MNTKLMKYDRVPRKYHLLWNDSERAITIKIHRDCLKLIKPLPENSSWIRAMSERHDIDGLFDSFSSDLSGNSFGFNQAIKKVRESVDYLDFIVPIPKIKIRTPFSCVDCSGKGKNDSEFMTGDGCLFCSGSGKRQIYDWRSAYITTASLSLLFSVLDIPEDTSAKEQQYVTVSMMADHGQHGSSLYGCFGIDFLNQLRSMSHKFIRISESVHKTMATVHARMFPMDNYADMGIRVEIDDRSIGLTCPGDACGINSSSHYHKNGEGCEIICHNVDSPLQSLTLLVGIAAMIGEVDLHNSVNDKMKVYF